MNNTHLLTGAALIAAAIAPQGALAQQKTNVLFIAIDDLKPMLGCYGDDLAQTPNIDALAQSGVLFENAYCQQAVSGPSRASLLTGMRPDQTQVWDLKTLIRSKNADVVTLPQRFNQSGYKVQGIGKIYDPRSVDKQLDKLSWSTPYVEYSEYFNPEYDEPVMAQYQSEEFKAQYEELAKVYRDQGLKGWGVNAEVQKSLKPSVEAADVADDAYSDGAIANGAIALIESLDPNEPFFLAVGFKRPHLPFCAPTKYWDLYDREKIELAPYQKESKNAVGYAYHNSSEMVGYTDIPEFSSFNDITNLSIDEDKQRELIHGYYASVSYMDAQLGRVVDALRAKGLDKNTIIVLWGDHGWHLGDHGLWSKHTNFEQATRVPFIIVDPASKGGIKLSNPVELLDIYPTLCDYAGIEVGEDQSGGSLRSLVESGVAAAEDKPYAVSQFHRGRTMGYSLRTERYRYTVWVEWDRKGTASGNEVKAVELYDYLVDPLETENVAKSSKYKDAVALMNGYWEEFRKSNK